MNPSSDSRSSTGSADLTRRLMLRYGLNGTRLYFSSQRGVTGLPQDGVTYEVTGPFHEKNDSGYTAGAVLTCSDCSA